jgi:hypothetical protein
MFISLKHNNDIEAVKKTDLNALKRKLNDVFVELNTITNGDKMEAELIKTTTTYTDKILLYLEYRTKGQSVDKVEIELSKIAVVFKDVFKNYVQLFRTAVTDSSRSAPNRAQSTNTESQGESKGQWHRTTYTPAAKASATPAQAGGTRQTTQQSTQSSSSRTNDYTPSSRTPEPTPSSRTNDYASSRTTEHTPSSRTNDYASSRTTEHTPSSRTPEPTPSSRTPEPTPSSRTPEPSRTTDIPSSASEDKAPSTRAAAPAQTQDSGAPPGESEADKRKRMIEEKKRQILQKKMDEQKKQDAEKEKLEEWQKSMADAVRSRVRNPVDENTRKGRNHVKIYERMGNPT